MNVVELAPCGGNATASTNLDLDKRQTAVEAQVVDLMNLADKIQANLKTVTQQIRRLKESREEVIAA